MRSYRLMAADGGTILAVEAQDGLLVSLTSINDRLTDISQLIFASSITSIDMDTVAQQIVDSGNPDTFGLVDLTNDSREGTGDLWLDLPFDPPEVWAAGVTYKSSEMERRRESDTLMYIQRFTLRTGLNCFLRLQQSGVLAHLSPWEYVRTQNGMSLNQNWPSFCTKKRSLGTRLATT